MSVFRPPYEEKHKAATQTCVETFNDEHNKAAEIKGIEVFAKDMKKRKAKCPYWVTVIYRIVLFILCLVIPSVFHTLFIYGGSSPGALGTILIYGPFIYFIVSTFKGKLDLQCMKQPEEPASAAPDSPESAAEAPKPEAPVHTVHLAKMQIPAPDSESTVEITKSSRPDTVTLVIAIVIGLIFLLVVFFIIKQSASGSSTTKLQNQAHEIAEIARKMGLPEDNPIIVEAKRIYATASKTGQTTLDETLENSQPIFSLPPSPPHPDTLKYIFTRPETGETYFENNFENRNSEIKVSVDGESDYYILLEYKPTTQLEKLTGSKKFAFYVRAGDTATVAVPTGIAKLYYASGEAWHGIIDLFGDSTIYQTSNEDLDFESYTYELTLYPVPGGDFNTYEIDAADFPT